MAWNYYFKDRSGAQNGPVSFEELVRLARAGRLAPDCLVWPEGGAPRAARDMPDIVAAMNTPAPAGGAGGGGPLQADFPVWGLFWRMLAFGFGILPIIPAAWLGPWYYGWQASRVRLPNGPRLHLEAAFASGAALFFFLALATVAPAIYDGVAVAADPAATQRADVGAVRLIGQVAQLICQYQILRWFSGALRSEDGALRVAFSGGFWPYLGWTVLAGLSIFTIIGWAWVVRFATRWICRNTTGTHAFEFVGEGLSILWRTIVLILASIFIIPIPWVIAWFANWFVSQIVVTPGAENPALAQSVAA
jgi:hypothetical protein